MAVNRPGRPGTIRGEATARGVTEYEIRRERNTPTKLVWPKWIEPEQKRRMQEAIPPQWRRRAIAELERQVRVWAHNANRGTERAPLFRQRMADFAREDYPQNTDPLVWYHPSMRKYNK
jgi:hypothetical protein